VAGADALRALSQEWAQVQELLSPGAHDRLASLVDDLAAAADEVDPGADPDADLAEIATTIARLMAAELPVGHPVQAAAVAAVTRLVTAPDWRGLSGALLTVSQPDRQAARNWLLASPAAASDRGWAGLIRLTRPDGSVHLPAFQLDPNGIPLPLVVSVNEVLDAANDPWGAADWWLGQNAWLGAAPAEVLGQVSAEALLAAARDLSADS
jgi:hypothetical protein